jgi:hypothetical protein
MTPGNNPEDFKQHYDHGGSLQLHKKRMSHKLHTIKINMDIMKPSGVP